MAEQIDVPAVGKVKKEYVYVAGALVVGVVGYAYWRRRQSAGADAAPDYYADTRTGSELPTDGYTNPAPSGSGTSETGDEWRAPSSNQQWAQQALERLSWYEPGYVSVTTGKYLAGQPLTAEEATLIREIWAQIGHPPNDKAIIAVGTTVTPTEQPDVPTTAPTLRADQVWRDHVSLTWTAVPGVTGYQVYSNKNVRLVSVTGTHYDHGNLTPARSYGFKVRALGRTGQGPFSNTVIVNTPK